MNIREVQTGERSGEMWIITSGLMPGDRVVTEGTSKVAEGAVVNPKPDSSAAPAAGAASSRMSKFFINRPIVAMVIAILMVVIGLVSALTLPVAQFPNIVPPEIQVTATYPGADAQTLEQSVATPLEEQISGVDNMSYMYSVNSSSGPVRSPSISMSPPTPISIRS